MTVPLSEAVARRVPAALSAKQARGVLCAWTMFVTLRDSASNRSTSPAPDLEEEIGAADGGDANGVLGESRGDG